MKPEDHKNLKLSEFVRGAVDECDKLIEAGEALSIPYIPSSSVWHSYQTHSAYSDKACFFCLAGALMAQKAAWHEYCTPHDSAFDEFRDALNALDALRTGYPQCAVRRYTGDESAKIVGSAEAEMEIYYDGKVEWQEAREKILARADFLQEQGY